MSNYTLLAIPYFIFLGAVLEKAGIAERLLETTGIIFGRLRGGLALAVVLVGALLAATTGVVAATVGCLGATILAYFNGQLNRKMLVGACDDTIRTTSMVIFILFGSTLFSLVFRALEGDRFMFHVLSNLPGGNVGFMLVSMSVVFCLGFFIDICCRGEDLLVLFG